MIVGVILPNLILTIDKDWVPSNLNHSIDNYDPNWCSNGPLDNNMRTFDVYVEYNDGQIVQVHDTFIELLSTLFQWQHHMKLSKQCSNESSISNDAI